MTLQEAKDQIAKDYGYENWFYVDLSKESEEVMRDKVAELYARAKWDEACQKQGQIIFTMCADFHTTGRAPKPEFKP